MPGMDRVHPKVPAQREAAEWWVAEVRADLERVAMTRSGRWRAREIVVEHAGRVSPTVLTSVSFLLGVGGLGEREDHEVGKLARIVDALAPKEAA